MRLARAVVLAAAVLGAGSMRAAPGWREVTWPFPRDAWAAGRAFRCDDASCGGQQEVYVRAKLGFCSCTGGVRGDEEVDGVSDVDLISERFVPRGPGEVVVAGGLVGRTRAYTLQLEDGTERPAAGFALSRRCDLVAVASQGRNAGTAAARAGVVGLLESAEVAGWVRGLVGRG